MNMQTRYQVRFTPMSTLDLQHAFSSSQICNSVEPFEKVLLPDSTSPKNI